MQSYFISNLYKYRIVPAVFTFPQYIFKNIFTDLQIDCLLYFNSNELYQGFYINKLRK